VTIAGADTNHFFVTSPLPGSFKATRIWVLGDSGTGTTNQVKVRNAFETFTGTRHTDLWLMLGDNAYPNGTDSEFQTALFNIYTNMLRKSVLWPTLGNHETYSVNPNGNHAPFDIFTLPRNGEAGGFASGTEHYYSFDYANIHFVCLDSMETPRSSTGLMAQWLTNDLANTTADWIIAFFHHPPYTKGSHNSDDYTDSDGALVQMRTNIIPLLEDGGVDLVLAGHSHCYERSFLLDRHYGYSPSLSPTNKLNAGSGRESGTGAYAKPVGGPIPHQGAVYAVVGSSGQISGGSLNHPAMFVSLNNPGSMVLDISSNRLDAKFLREDGTTNDDFAILKLNYPPAANDLAANVAGDFPATFTLQGGDINHDSISFVPNTSPTHGLLSAFNPATGEFTYTPAHGFIGNDGFTFRVSDGQTNSLPATVSLAVSAPPDTNANGMADYWESTFGFPSPESDADTDGLTASQEYWANTDPGNPASVLRLLTISRDANGHCTLTWASVGGTRYRVSYADTLGESFANLARPVLLEMDAAVTGTASTNSFTDDFALTGGPPTTGARYYQVKVVR